MDYSPPDSSVHGVLQARILEQVAISFSGTETDRHTNLDQPEHLQHPYSLAEAEALVGVRRDERPLVRGLTIATLAVGVSLDAAAALEDGRSTNLYSLRRLLPAASLPRALASGRFRHGFS